MKFFKSNIFFHENLSVKVEIKFKCSLAFLSISIDTVAKSVFDFVGLRMSTIDRAYLDN